MRIILLDGQTMKRVGENTYDIQNKEVKMNYIRRCGTSVDYTRKDEDCPCVECTTKRVRLEIESNKLVAKILPNSAYGKMKGVE